VLVQIQQQGGHAGQLSDDELAQVIAWIEAGAPEKPGAATPPPAATTTEGWIDGIDQLVNAKCATCHVNASLGNLSLKTYADALKGGNSGPAVVPNDPDQSVLVQVQQKGGHAGQFTPEELDRIVKWIEAGAPEVASTTTGPTSTPAPGVEVESWSDAFALFTAKCTMCHINAQAGNLSLRTYQDALKGGKNGPAITPGDPAKSMLVTTQQGTDHPSMGRLTPEELAAIIAWIEAGAPEVTSKTWTDAFAIFTAKCAMCHINAQAGNLSLKTYQDALKGGKSGPAIVPGDPDKSVLVTTQQGSAHPSMGLLTPKELADIIAWIEAGAPEK
jgi:mono/diheme cytochrome c family protein